jgi:hypothetical protein
MRFNLRNREIGSFPLLLTHFHEERTALIAADWSAEAADEPRKQVKVREASN